MRPIKYVCAATVSGLLLSACNQLAGGAGAQRAGLISPDSAAAVAAKNKNLAVEKSVVDTQLKKGRSTYVLSSAGQSLWLEGKFSAEPLYVRPVGEKLDIANQPFSRIGEEGFEWLNIDTAADAGQLLAIDTAAGREDPPYLTRQGRANLLSDSPYHRPLWQVRFGEMVGWVPSSQLAINWPGLDTEEPLEHQLAKLRLSGLLLSPFLPQVERHKCTLPPGTPMVNLALEIPATQPWSGHRTQATVAAAAYRPDAGPDEIQSLIVATDEQANTLFCFESDNGNSGFLGSFANDHSQADSPLLLKVAFADLNSDQVIDWSVSLALISGDGFIPVDLIVDGQQFQSGKLSFRIAIM